MGVKRIDKSAEDKELIKKTKEKKVKEEEAIVRRKRKASKDPWAGKIPKDFKPIPKMEKEKNVMISTHNIHLFEKKKKAK